MSVRLIQAQYIWRKYGAREVVKRALRAVVRERADVPFRERLWLRTQGFKPISYILYDFASKTTQQRLNYLPDTALSKMRGINQGPSAFLTSKLVFYRMAEMAGIRCPELVATVTRGRLIESRPPYSEIALNQLAQRGGDFFVKPLTGGRGVGVRRVKAEHLPLLDFNPGERCLIVKTVEQAEYSRRIFEAASNTVRIAAFRTPGTRAVFIASAVHRFGSAKTAPLDSFFKGGVSCEIDLETGRMGPGIRHPSVTGGGLAKYTHHPDSGSSLEGVQLPVWSGAVKLVHELMDLFPEIEFAGWDLLATDEGWAVIEGNSTMGIDVLQVHRGLLSDHRVRDFARYHGLV